MKLQNFSVNLSGEKMMWSVSVRLLCCYHGKQLSTGNFFKLSFKIEKITFLMVIVVFLSHASVPLLVLITFRLILALS